jgi:hypothetical protein
VILLFASTLWRVNCVDFMSMSNQLKNLGQKVKPKIRTSVGVQPLPRNNLLHAVVRAGASRRVAMDTTSRGVATVSMTTGTTQGRSVGQWRRRKHDGESQICFATRQTWDGVYRSRACDPVA